MLLFKFISTFQRTFKASSINRRSLFCFSRCDAGSLRFTISPRGSQDQRGGNCLCRFTCAPFASLPDGRTTGERELYLYFPRLNADGLQIGQSLGASLRFFSRRSSVRSPGQVRASFHVIPRSRQTASIRAPSPLAWRSSLVSRSSQTHV